MGKLIPAVILSIAALEGIWAYRISQHNVTALRTIPVVEQKAQPVENLPLEKILENTAIEKEERPEFEYLPVDRIYTFSHSNLDYGSDPKSYMIMGVEGCLNKNSELKVPYGTLEVTDWKPYSVNGKKCGFGMAVSRKEDVE